MLLILLPKLYAAKDLQFGYLDFQFGSWLFESRLGVFSGRIQQLEIEE